MTEKERMIFAGLFSNPLEVINKQGQFQILDWDESEYPLMFNNDGMPIALIKLPDGNGAFIRYDKKPPRLSGFDLKPNRFLIDESDFVTLVGATRAGQSVESYLFNELFKYPFKVAHPETGEMTQIIVESIGTFNVGGVPVALMSHADYWTPVRFDCDPPQSCWLHTKDGEIIHKDEFIRLILKTR